MAAQALYLKYRPLTFEEVVGQEPITRTLRNALRQGRIRHAYLFAGPRGTGKTTTARLLAKAVNCLAPEAERPCNLCERCTAVNEGRFLDLMEIDAASNRGIDEIRDIREKVGFRPNEGRYRVYVLDEAHMLTEPAFNALLKTLEEPPPHAIFALVTTEPHKIPATITSRCQRFDFVRIPLQAMMERLSTIAGREGLGVEPAALELIARAGTGAMRDAVSLLDQLASYGDEISLAQVQMILGAVAGEAAAGVVSSVVDGDVARGLELINRAIGDGADPRQLGREIVEYLRGLLLIGEGAGTSLVNATAEQAAEMEALAARIPVERLLRAIHLFNEATGDLRRGIQTIPQLALELALVESSGDWGRKTEGRLITRPGRAEYPSAATSPWATPERALSPEAVAAEEGGRPAPPDERPSASVVEGAEAAGGVAPEAEPPARTGGEPRFAGQEAGGDTPAGPSVSLERVRAAWPRVLEAVRTRNPTTVAALNTGCKPVDVSGREIVVTFPYPVLREKLSTPQRKSEIQEAMGEVLGFDCRVTLILAADFAPRAETQEGEAAPAGARTAANDQAPQALDAAALDQISRWAKERGGEASVVE